MNQSGFDRPEEDIDLSGEKTQNTSRL